MTKILKRRPGDPCCGSCISIYKDWNGPANLLTRCCEYSDGQFGVFHPSSPPSNPAPASFRDSLDRAALVYMNPVIVTHFDANGDGEIDEDDWYVTGFSGPNLDDVGDWIYDGGRAILCVQNYVDQPYNAFYYGKVTDKLSTVGSSMEFSNELCDYTTTGGFGSVETWAQTSDFNTSVGFPLVDPVFNYKKVHRLTGGTWLFRTPTTGEDSCPSAMPVLAAEKIGDGLLVVCASDAAINSYTVTDDNQGMNCPVFQAIIDTPIEDLTC